MNLPTGRTGFNMAFKVVLIGSILAQLVATCLSLRINARYRRYSAWALISASSVLLAIMQFAVLLIFWETDGPLQADGQLQIGISSSGWVSCLNTLMVSALLASVLFLGGVALIEPLFIGAAKAESLLKKEKKELESVVRATDAELRLAQQIQQRLLPRRSPDIPGFDISGQCTAAQWTSGDYFDYIKMNDGTLCVVIADVTGHGTGPALLMATTRALLRALAQASSNIGDILSSANRSLSDDLERGWFVTMFAAGIEPKTGTLVYSNAGQNGYFFTEDGNVRTLGMERPPLGVLSDADLSTADSVQMKKGDSLLLVSDGIPETKSPSGELYGHNRMFECFRQNREQSAEQIVRALIDSVRQFADHAPQEDDVTAVVVVRR
ncbi:MAG: PP2C family protein-serine/threonine phosphatase [Fuerstiella sp.]|nr:PP2C family protein-serine/threonine phosphatase [Fuerstiella sp.]